MIFEHIIPKKVQCGYIDYMHQSIIYIRTRTVFCFDVLYMILFETLAALVSILVLQVYVVKVNPLKCPQVRCETAWISTGISETSSNRSNHESCTG